LSPATPEIAVCVASHERALRLRWLLNSLEEQTLPRERFEVIVAHDSVGEETASLLASHAIGAISLRFDPPAPGVNSATKLRNAAWRAATAPLIAFTDDDCRAPADWLANALAAAGQHPGAVVQGRTLPDPDEEPNLHGAFPRTQRVFPPVPWGQACNIVYPRELLESLGGFVEDPPLAAGEDAELALRARASGAPYVGAKQALTFHAVYDESLVQHLRGLSRWGDLAWYLKTHPEARADYPLGMFWKRTHVWLPVAAAGAVLAHRRGAAWALLALPWAAHSAPAYGEGNPRGRLRAASELPLRAVVDAAEMVACLRGAIRHKTPFL
jgi:glycosyltransferase involved in cell wall biosynthesis